LLSNKKLLQRIKIAESLLSTSKMKKEKKCREGVNFTNHVAQNGKIEQLPLHFALKFLETGKP